MSSAEDSRIRGGLPVIGRGVVGKTASFHRCSYSALFLLPGRGNRCQTRCIRNTERRGESGIHPIGMTRLVVITIRADIHKILGLGSQTGHHFTDTGNRTVMEHNRLVVNRREVVYLRGRYHQFKLSSRTGRPTDQRCGGLRRDTRDGSIQTLRLRIHAYQIQYYTVTTRLCRLESQLTGSCTASSR